MAERQLLRRARPWLGTLVDIGVPVGADKALEAAFDVMREVQRHMSVFEPESDLSRAHAAPVGHATHLHPWTAEVLSQALALHEQTEGLFDVALGTGDWRLVQDGDTHGLIRLHHGTRLDLGGLAKGWAVDRALQAALDHGAQAAWINAGGDLRVQGLTLPVFLRHETEGGASHWADLSDGAMATSDFRPGARARLSGRCLANHVSVIAPCCAWADGLTKVLALLGDPGHPLARDLLRYYDAGAWVHQDSPCLLP